MRMNLLFLKALLENRSIANYRHLLDGIDLLAIDEAQNIPQIGSILKLIVDEIPGISVLASGSSSCDDGAARAAGKHDAREQNGHGDEEGNLL